MNTFEALNSIVWYNGYDNMVRSMKNTIQKAKKKNAAVCQWDDREEYDPEVGYIFWSILVLRFGDYGTSPRYGWIEPEHFSEAIDYLRGLLRGHPKS